MQMPGRNGSTGDYRYGFNGVETDDEWTGSESHVAFTNRCYDARLGRFLSLDRFAGRFPEQSPYLFANNTPIQGIDFQGDSLVVKAGRGAQISSEINAALKLAYGDEWGNAVSSKRFSVKAAGVTFAVDYIVPNPGVNWNKDEYSRALFDILYTNRLYDLQLVDREEDKMLTYSERNGNSIDDTYNLPHRHNLLKNNGGGKTSVEDRIVYIADELPSATEGRGTLKLPSMGSVILHEVIYHLHYGVAKKNASTNVNVALNITNGSSHGSDADNDTRYDYSFGEKVRLARARVIFSAGAAVNDARAKTDDH
jgi:RHS repeat-associated protein